MNLSACESKWEEKCFVTVLVDLSLISRRQTNGQNWIQIYIYHTLYTNSSRPTVKELESSVLGQNIYFCGGVTFFDVFWPFKIQIQIHLLLTLVPFLLPVC